MLKKHQPIKKPRMMKAFGYKLDRKRGDKLRKRSEAFTAKLCREFIKGITPQEQKQLSHHVSGRLRAHSIDAIKYRIAELLRQELELRMLTLLLQPDWVRPEIGKVIKPCFERVFDQKRCNIDCKYMYFCGLKKGHKGLHTENGLYWD